MATHKRINVAVGVQVEPLGEETAKRPYDDLVYLLPPTQSYQNPSLPNVLTGLLQKRLSTIVTSFIPQDLITKLMDLKMVTQESIYMKT